MQRISGDRKTPPKTLATLQEHITELEQEITRTRQKIMSIQREVIEKTDVTRARITQIMNLRLLAPDIQEKLIFHKRIHGTKDSILLRDLQKLAVKADWGKQRSLHQKSVVGRN